MISSMLLKMVELKMASNGSIHTLQWHIQMKIQTKKENNQTNNGTKMKTKRMIEFFHPHQSMSPLEGPLHVTSKRGGCKGKVN